MSSRTTSTSTRARSARASVSDPAVPTTLRPGWAARIAAVPSRTTGWSSTIAMRIPGVVIGGSVRSPLEADVGAAARPRAHVENGVDLLGALAHVQEAEPAGMLGEVRRARRDARAGVVDGEHDAVLGRVVAHDDRRLPVPGRVRQPLLGHPEEGQLHVRRRPDPVAPLKTDLTAGEHLDPPDQPVEGGADPEVIQDREAEVAADRPQALDHAAAHRRPLGVPRTVEPPNEEGQLLERI